MIVNMSNHRKILNKYVNEVFTPIKLRSEWIKKQFINGNYLNE